MTNQPPVPKQPNQPSPPPKPPSDLHAFVASRDRAYDDAWLKTAQIQRMLEVAITQIWQTPYSFAWTMILNKLIRATATPENKDHWLDIQGYCQLVLEELAKGK